MPDEFTESVLGEAFRLITNDRRDDYGDVHESFSVIAQLWSPIIGRPVTPNEVALCMILLKVARAQHGYQRDSLVDIAGYAGCLEMLLDHERGTPIS